MPRTAYAVVWGIVYAATWSTGRPYGSYAIGCLRPHRPPSEYSGRLAFGLVCRRATTASAYFSDVSSATGAKSCDVNSVKRYDINPAVNTYSTERRTRSLRAASTHLRPDTASKFYDNPARGRMTSKHVTCDRARRLDACSRLSTDPAEASTAASGLVRGWQLAPRPSRAEPCP